MSSSSMRPDGEPTVTATLAAEDAVYEVSPRYGSVVIKGLSLEAQTVLTKFDRNGDGEVDESELEGVVDVLVKEQFKGRMFLSGILMVTFSLILLLASSFGLTWAVVSLHTDTTIRGRVIVRKHSDQPLQLASSDLTVDPTSGALLSRGSKVVGTSTLYTSRSLNANMTTRLLNTLARISVNGTDGVQVGFRVTGYAVTASSPPELHISTPTGVLVLVGDRLSGASAAASLLETGGGGRELVGQSVVGLFTAT
ncbi:hypothetical protein PLESTB_000470600 [Pleodorina starrii]|uniref:EF-hand domain-containing protein n=1 Tax=Pleodorina starrii TaxID=330485 RepID=A0A9W6BFI1_9CHLO|nr:hypothetical protein PLESTB_000470600 [Pleodorina starrii]